MAKKKMGRPPKLGQMQAFPLRLPAELHGALRVCAAARGQSMNELLLGLIDKSWRQVPKRKTYEQLAASG